MNSETTKNLLFRLAVEIDGNFSENMLSTNAACDVSPSIVL